MTRRKRFAHPNGEDDYLQKFGIPPRFLQAELPPDFQMDDPPGSYYLYGPAGVGKTYRLCSMMREVLLNNGNGGMTAVFLPVEEMFSQIRDSYNKSVSESDYTTTQLMEVDLLVLDDLGSERITEWTMGELYRIINHRYNYLKTTWFSSNMDLSSMAKEFNVRIASRIRGMCKVIYMSGVDQRNHRSV